MLSDEACKASHLPVAFSVLSPQPSLASYVRSAVVESYDVVVVGAEPVADVMVPDASSGIQDSGVRSVFELPGDRMDCGIHWAHSMGP